MGRAANSNGRYKCHMRWDIFDLDEYEAREKKKKKKKKAAKKCQCGNNKFRGRNERLQDDDNRIVRGNDV